MASKSNGGYGNNKLRPHGKGMHGGHGFKLGATKNSPYGTRNRGHQGRPSVHMASNS